MRFLSSSTMRQSGPPMPLTPRSNPRRQAFCRLNMKSPPLRRELQSQADLQQAQAEAQAAKTAPQQITISRAQAQSAEARVQLAKVALDQARLNFEYTSIKAPVSGIVSKKTVEAGQVVQAGQPLMAIIPQEDIWVIANFKETQLADIHPGQSGTVSVDAYGGQVYKVRVDSVASATGAKFSLLPRK